MKEMRYRTFMKDVENLLQALTKEELKDILLSFASEEHASKRRIFLARLLSSNRRGEKYTIDVHALLEEIGEFYKRVYDGEYCDGWGWDHEIHGERDFGDESWAQEMDEFLVEARDLLYQGQYEGAEEAYQLLFSIIEMGGEPGHLPGDPDIHFMLDEVLDEHIASFLRAVYMNASLEERPEEIYAAYSRCYYFSHEHITWKDVVEVIEDPLPEHEIFLKNWVTYLKDQGQGADELLREAIVLQGGISFLLEFANKNATTNPEVYIDLIEALREKGDEEGLLRIIQEGLIKIPADYTVRAKVAKSLADIGIIRGITEFIIEGTWEAFYSSPSLKSLIDLYTTAIEEGCFKEVIGPAQERIQDLLYKPVSSLCGISRAKVSETLFVNALLLGGQDEKAFAIILQKDEHSSITSLFLSCALLLLSKEGHYQEIILKVWEEALDGVRPLDRSHKEKYRMLLGKVAKENFQNKEKEEAYLTWSLEMVDRLVNSIVKNKYQTEYPRVAAYIVAMAETLVSRGEEGRAKEFVMMYRARFPRHRAFLRELTEVLGYSNSLDI